MAKKIISVCLAVVLIMGALTACAKKTETNEPEKTVTNDSSTTNSTGSNEPKKTYELTVSGINGSINYTPVYIAREKGFFDEAGLKIKEVMFDNGPVQMEALSSNSWDIGATGVGGVLSGAIGYGAYLVGASNSDNGTQTIWVRKDSKMAAAGTGNNTVNNTIIGDAASWKGAQVLCTSGNVLQYLLLKTLGGFGLSLDDIEFVSMDSPTANSAFLAGQGDAAVVTGAISFSKDKDDYVLASSGNLADTGLMCNFMANKDSYNDPAKYEAMKVFMEVYFKTIEWMNDNKEEAAQLCSDFNQECGINLSPETATLYLGQDPYYSLENVYKMMHDKAEGADYSVMEGKLIDVLKFFIQYGNYKDGDDQKFLGHMDTKLIDEVYADLKAK
jgi:ABC-type nitrate/sulfonate/bicarbonate transport system substrate-binding protein